MDDEGVVDDEVEFEDDPIKPEPLIDLEDLETFLDKRIARWQANGRPQSEIDGTMSGYAKKLIADHELAVSEALRAESEARLAIADNPVADRKPIGATARKHLTAAKIQEGDFDA
jgi:hypothetical protein